MSVFQKYKDKKIGILGLGKTGLSVLHALNGIANIICYDDNDLSIAKINDESLISQITDPRWTTLDYILSSPGIKLDHPILHLANEHNIPIISDIDILFEVNHKAYFIGITGTNGKSTTTALIGHILNQSSINYPVGGNIGIPVLEMPLDAGGYVLELSSFQLMLCKYFKPNIAVLLNITPDHLDIHGSIEGYTKAKEKIFSADQKQIQIINADNPITAQLLSSKYTHAIPISTISIQSKGVAYIADEIYDNFFDHGAIIQASQNKFLQGEHNKENILAAYCVAKCLKIDTTKIIESISSFAGLPHRMEYIGSLLGVNYYNDSKATNAESTKHALKALDNIYWILGGIPKEGGIDSLSSLFYKVKKAYIIGKDKSGFIKTLSGKVNFEQFDSLEAAIETAYLDSKDDTGANILLSPSAASYDMFKNFEHRGQCFKELYSQIKSRSLC